MKKVNKASLIRQYLNANPDAKATEIAKKFKVVPRYVHQIKYSMKPKRVVLNPTQVAVAKKMGVSVEEMAKMEMKKPKAKPKVKVKTVDPVDNLPKVGDSIGGLTLTRKINDDGNGYVYRWVRDSMVESGEVQVDEDPRLPKFDNVNHPAHYKSGGIETIDFIEAKELGYHLGNVIKYVTRAKHKGNEIEDLKKAQWYLNREISKLTGDKA